MRRLGPMAGGFGGPGAGGFGGFGGRAGGTFRVEDMGDLGDVFGGLFGGGAGRAQRRRPGGPSAGPTSRAELHLDFADAIHGATVTVNLPQDVRCHTCNGSGAAPGTDSRTCDRCGGRGTLDDNQGLFSLSTICPKCNGRGTLVESPCPTCRGDRHRAAHPQGQGADPARGGGRPAHPGEGPRARRARAWPRPATSTWWSRWASTRCSGAVAATSP